MGSQLGSHATEGASTLSADVWKGTAVHARETPVPMAETGAGGGS